MAKKVHIVGISQCFLDDGRGRVLDLFADKKNRMDTVFARKDDSGILSWVRGQIAAENKSVVVENNGNIARLNNASIFYNSKIKFITDYIKGNIGKKNILILANGDPNFFGIGASILETLKENEKRLIEIHPAVSFMQIGFSRLKIPMTDAVIISLHGRDLNNLYEPLNSKKPTVGIYTDDVNTPSRIHSEMEEKGFLCDYEFYVLTDLCSKNEKIYKSLTKDILEDTSLKKNIIILNLKAAGRRPEARKAAAAVVHAAGAGVSAGTAAGITVGTASGSAAFAAATPEKAAESEVIGIDDDKYIHGSGEPTKKEIRAISIAMLNLRRNSTVVDAGCGSGSVSIEASGIADKGVVYAIDKDRRKIDNLKGNIKKFKRPNIKPVLGELPEALGAPGMEDQVDSVFIGGGGAGIGAILRRSLDILKDGGVIVVNSVTLNSLNRVLSFISEYNSDAVESGNAAALIKYEIISVNVARLKPINDKDDSYFQALNQIYIARLTKGAKAAKTAATNATPDKPSAPAAGRYKRRHKHVFKKDVNAGASGHPSAKEETKAAEGPDGDKA